MTSRWTKRSVVVLLVLAAACGGKSTPSARRSAPSPTPTGCLGKLVPIQFPTCPLSEVDIKDATAQGQNIDLPMDAGEGAWGPTYIKAKPGAHVTLVIDGGIGNHSFTIDSLNLNQEVPGGKQTTVSFTLPSTGPVIFYCIPHRSRGMQGAFYFS
jgi:plastocyanin